MGPRHETVCQKGVVVTHHFPENSHHKLVKIAGGKIEGGECTRRVLFSLVHGAQIVPEIRTIVRSERQKGIKAGGKTALINVETTLRSTGVVGGGVIGPYICEKRKNIWDEVDFELKGMGNRG